MKYTSVSHNGALDHATKKIRCKEHGLQDTKVSCRHLIISKNNRIKRILNFSPDGEAVWCDGCQKSSIGNAFGNEFLIDNFILVCEKCFEEIVKAHTD